MEKEQFLLIKSSFGKYLCLEYDYELDNGLMLFCYDWNGEAYIRSLNLETNEWNNNSFVPIYRFQVENVDLDKVEPNTLEWYRLCEIIGFKEE